MRVLFSVLLLFSLVLPGYGQSNHLEQFMDSLVSRGPIPGMHLVVYHNGKEVYDQVHGYSRPEIGELLDTNAIYRLHSMTKPIISVALLKLESEGRIDLNAPLRNYIPEFHKPQQILKNGNLHASAKPILVRHLLTHQSGLGYGFDAAPIDSLYRSINFTEYRDLQDFTSQVAELPLYEEPGTLWRYGINHTLAGRLVAVASGRSLPEFLQQELFEPLGMKDTGFQPDAVQKERVIPQYLLRGSVMIPDPRPESQVPQDVKFFNGGGGLYATTLDYLKFTQMLLQQGSLNGTQIVPDSAITKLHQDHLGDKKWHRAARGPGLEWYGGFGMGVAVTNPRKHISNPAPEGSYGWGGAAGTFFHIDPENRLIILVMAQLFPATAYEDLRNAIITKIYALLPEMERPTR